MKAKFSPLELLDFKLLESNYKFITPKEDEINVIALFKLYSVNINFNHIPLEENIIQVAVNIEVNNLKRPKPGYSLSCGGMGIFKIDDQSEMKQDFLGNLKYYSTLNMVINNLRNVMFQISNLGPMSGYLLPPVDILDLFKKKKKEERRKNKKVNL